MSILRAAQFFVCLLTPGLALCQQAPASPTPEAVKAVREQEKQLRDSMDESNKHPGPRIRDLQCRADTQNWTLDPFDKSDPAALLGGVGLQVNGQFRLMPELTPNVTVSVLIDRAYEMSVCIHEDADFEKQFGTYSLMFKRYEEERIFRYMYFLMRHNLQDQFNREDVERNK